MRAYDLASVPRIVAGPGWSRMAGGEAAALLGRGAAVLFVVDPGLRAGGLVDAVEARLAAAGLAVTVFSDFAGDPTAAQVDAAADVARRSGVDGIVAMGGGSALDLGKSVAAIATAAEPAVHYQLCENPLPARRLTSIVIPSTSGTGSETTRTAIVTRADKAKVWLWGEPIKPDLVILDPEATVSLPPALTAQTGIDALVHAIEAATNRNATPANDLYAHEAIRLAAVNLVRAVEHGSDIAARAAMQRAAMLAGIAIDNAGTAIAHNIGHALGSLHPIHHGRAVALGMMATLAWNVAADNGRFAAAARAMGLTSAADLPKAFEALVRNAGITVALGDAGVTAADLATQMARPENAAMRNSNFRAIGDGDLLDFAARVLEQT